MSERMLNDDITRQLIDVLAGMVHPVEVLLFSSQTENCEYCAETRQLLEEVTAVTEKLSLETYELEDAADLARELGVERVPTFVITSLREGKRVDHGIRYKGIPAGHEFTSLINDLLMVSRNDSGLSEETRSFLATLKSPVHLEVFVTPT